MNTLSSDKPRYALFSVYEKPGCEILARVLANAGITVLSTGNTAKYLREHDIPVTDVSEHTGFPEMLDGRVKTLHPKIAGGLLYIRGNADHEETVEKHGIGPIDFVVVNLYPFEKKLKENAAFEEMIENIDVGGPNMLRAGAKNHDAVTVLTDPTDYPRVIAQVKENGKTSPLVRLELAAKAFERTATYDSKIGVYLRGVFQSRVAKHIATLPE